MVYLLDENKNNALTQIYNCGYIIDGTYRSKIKYHKSDDGNAIDLEKLSNSDFVCFHNSFPNEKNKIIARINLRHEEKPDFYLISFSGDSSHYNTYYSGTFIKIHKDRFYQNLKLFIDSEYDIRKLLYGELYKKNEAETIFRRINDILFYQSSNNLVDIKDFKPKDIKRLCELSEYSYPEFMNRIEGKTISEFKSFINYLVNNI